MDKDNSLSEFVVEAVANPSTANREAVLNIITANRIDTHIPGLHGKIRDEEATTEILSLMPNCETCKVMLSAMNVHPKTVEPKVLTDEIQQARDEVIEWMEKPCPHNEPSEDTFVNRGGCVRCISKLKAISPATIDKDETLYMSIATATSCLAVQGYADGSYD